MMEVGFWQQLIGLSFLAFFAYLTYQSIKSNPGAFSGHNINKSFKSMGLLALLLIGFVTLLVGFLPQGNITGATAAQEASVRIGKDQYRSV
jgi:hypothetical protein